VNPLGQSGAPQGGADDDPVLPTAEKTDNCRRISGDLQFGQTISSSVELTSSSKL